MLHPIVMPSIIRELAFAQTMGWNQPRDGYALLAAMKICDSAETAITRGYVTALGITLRKSGWVRGTHQDIYQRTVFPCW